MINVTVRSGEAARVQVGENTGLSLVAAQRAENAAVAAESLVGPTYASTAAGLAATAEGGSFAVNNGDGTVTIYREVAGVAVEQRRLATTAALAAADGAERIGYAQGPAAPYIQTRNALDKLREFGASVKDTGAVGDYDTDDSDAVQEIFDYFGSRGGRWHLPPGMYKTTRSITIELGLSGQEVVGQGQRGTYPGQFDPDTYQGDLAVIVPAHTDRQAFLFEGVTGESAVTFQDLAIATFGPPLLGPRPTACFAWDTTDLQFDRTFRFLRVSINDFVSAFDAYQSSGDMKQVGTFWAQHCNIHRNEWIARTLNDTQWNGFSFCHNEAGQNGYNVGHGGIDVRGHNVTVFDNCLEGMRDPIRIQGAGRGVNIDANYLEACVGKALIQLEGVRGPARIGPQAELAINYGTLEHPVLLSNCGKIKCELPYRPNGVHKMPPQINGADAGTGDNVNNPNTGTSTDGILRVDSFDEAANYARASEFAALATQRVTIAARDRSPLTGEAMPVGEFTTGGAGSNKITFTHTIAGSSGDYAVVCMPMKFVPDAAALGVPYVSLKVNNAAGNGGRDYQISDLATWWRANEWMLVTMAIKLTGAMTSLVTEFSPYGATEVAGRKVRYLPPAVYVVDNPDKIVPYFDRFVAQSTTAAPAAGTWSQGDRLANASPSAANEAWHLCTVAGTPGTWVLA